MNTVTIPGTSTTMRRMGAAAVAFFLVKRLLWIIAPLVFLWLT